MDIAGLVIGVVGVVKPLAETAIDLCEVSHSSLQFGSDINALRVRIAVARRQTSTFEDVILTEKKVDWLPGSLFQELDPLQQQEFYDLFQELKRCLILFIEQCKAYGIDRHDPAAISKRIAGSNIQLIDGKERAQVYQSAVSWTQKLSWSTRNKDIMTDLVKDIEHWTSLLRLSVQDVLSTFPGLKELDRLDDLSRGLDEQAKDLQLALTIRRIFLTKPIELSQAASLIPIMDVTSVSVYQCGMIGILGSSQTTVYIETKKFSTSTDPTEDEERLAKTKQLATLLKHISDPHFRVLNAQGYNYDPMECCARIIYTIPTNLLPNPVDLQRLYAVKSQESRPSLETRFQLATAVVETLFFLHSLGWVHKSFSSRNILFFPQKSQRSTPWPVDASQEERISIHQLLRQSEMKLAGLEVARPEAALSSMSRTGRGDMNDLYRHPARWGSPTESFTASHDLYSLGAVLLEIGLWQRLDHLENQVRRDDPLRLREKLLRHATHRLPYTMGSRYAEIVSGYLRGSFEDASPSDRPSRWSITDPSHATNRILVLKNLHKASSCL